MSNLSLEIPCKLYTPSRLFSVLRSEPASGIAHFYQSNLYEKSLLFFEFVGDNYSSLETFISALEADRQSYFVIIDDTYEGLLTQEDIDNFSNLFDRMNLCYAFVSSNEKLKGKNVYTFSFHLCYKEYDNIDVQGSEFELNKLPRSKIFLCLNRQPRYHRYEVVDHLIKNNYIKDSLVSCPSFHFEDIQSDILQFDKQKKYLTEKYFDSNILNFSLDQEVAKRLKANLPILLDTTEYAMEKNKRHLPCPEHLFQSSYWSIINERDFYDDRYLGWTEKVLKSLFYCHPFLVVGLPYTLKSLKKLGFITFSSVIDESYDEIENDIERMQAIKHEIDKLAGLDYTDHHIIYHKKLLPILEHNRRNYIRLNQTYLPSTIITKVEEWYCRS